MRIDRIIKDIKAAGFPCKSGRSQAGPTVTAKVPGQDKGVCGLVPIDDESDNRFAAFLISEALKEMGGVSDGRSTTANEFS